MLDLARPGPERVGREMPKKEDEVARDGGCGEGDGEGEGEGEDNAV